mmetsp:Transcript_74406/g.206600  ORF Transcript_74406/g.206600 Transcript_74406/m.206600 type:complete len:207 (+) Transcript_74406:431-1051(+)
MLQRSARTARPRAAPPSAAARARWIGRRQRASGSTQSGTRASVAPQAATTSRVSSRASTCPVVRRRALRAATVPQRHQQPEPAHARPSVAAGTTSRRTRASAPAPAAGLTTAARTTSRLVSLASKSTAPSCWNHSSASATPRTPTSIGKTLSVTTSWRSGASRSGARAAGTTCRPSRTWGPMQSGRTASAHTSTTGSSWTTRTRSG